MKNVKRKYVAWAQAKGEYVLVEEGDAYFPELLRLPDSGIAHKDGRKPD